jgi:hypothetical protein
VLNRTINSDDLGLFYLLPKDILLLILNIVTAETDGWRLLMPFFLVNGGTYSYHKMKSFTDKLKVNIDFVNPIVAAKNGQPVNSVFNYSDIKHVLMRNHLSSTSLQYRAIAKTLQKYNKHSSNPHALSVENRDLLLEIEGSVQHLIRELSSADTKKFYAYLLSIIVATSSLLLCPQDLFSAPWLLVGAFVVAMSIPAANKQIALLEADLKDIPRIEAECFDSRNRSLMFKKPNWWLFHSIDINCVQSEGGINTLLDVNQHIEKQLNPPSPAARPSTEMAVVQLTQYSEKVTDIGATLFATGPIARAVALAYAMTSRVMRPN